MMSQFATKAHQIPIVYMGKPCLGVTFSQFWEREMGERSIKLLRPEACRTKRNGIIKSTELKKYQKQKRERGRNE